jgi:hypothetical protein
MNKKILGFEKEIWDGLGRSIGLGIDKTETNMETGQKKEYGLQDFCSAFEFQIYRLLKDHAYCGTTPHRADKNKRHVVVWDVWGKTYHLLQHYPEQIFQSVPQETRERLLAMRQTGRVWSALRERAQAEKEGIVLQRDAVTEKLLTEQEICDGIYAPYWWGTATSQQRIAYLRVRDRVGDCYDCWLSKIKGEGTELDVKTWRSDDYDISEIHEEFGEGTEGEENQIPTKILVVEKRYLDRTAKQYEDDCPTIREIRESGRLFSYPCTTRAGCKKD